MVHTQSQRHAVWANGAAWAQYGHRTEPTSITCARQAVCVTFGLTRRVPRSPRVPSSLLSMRVLPMLLRGCAVTCRADDTRRRAFAVVFVALLLPGLRAQTTSTAACTYLNNCHGHGTCVVVNTVGTCDCWGASYPLVVAWGCLLARTLHAPLSLPARVRACAEGWGADSDITLFRAPDCSQRECLAVRLLP